MNWACTKHRSTKSCLIKTIYTMPNHHPTSLPSKCLNQFIFYYHFHFISNSQGMLSTSVGQNYYVTYTLYTIGGTLLRERSERKREGVDEGCVYRWVRGNWERRIRSGGCWLSDNRVEAVRGSLVRSWRFLLRSLWWRWLQLCYFDTGFTSFIYVVDVAMEPARIKVAPTHLRNAISIPPMVPLFPPLSQNALSPALKLRSLATNRSFFSSHLLWHHLWSSFYLHLSS